jgi:hypothetical protein
MGFHQDLLVLFTFSDGRLLSVGALTVTATNLDGGKSAALDLSGSQTVTFNSDGSTDFSTTGGTLFIPPFAGSSTLTLLKGRLAETFDSEGNVVSVRLAGTTTDLCAVIGH